MPSRLPAQEKAFQQELRGMPKAEKKRRDDWTTPAELWRPIHEVWDFQLDAAADENSALVPQYFGPGSALAEDALQAPWSFAFDNLPVCPHPRAIYCNPPFSKKLAFLIKAQVESENGCYIVMMLPASTSEGWWKSLVVDWADYVIFLTGRVPFDNKNDNMGGNALAVFEPKIQGVDRFKPNSRGPLTFWWDWREARDLSGVGQANLYDLASGPSV